MQGAEILLQPGVLPRLLQGLWIDGVDRRDVRDRIRRGCSSAG